MWLLKLLFPGIDDELGGDETDEVDETDETDETDEVDETDGTDEVDETDEVDDAPPPKESRAQKEIRTLRERAQKAESLIAESNRQLAEARQPAAAQKPSHDQLMWEQEEAILKNPEATDWQRYSVQSARDARAANANSQRALQESRDLADRSEFKEVERMFPESVAKHRDKLEANLIAARKNGHEVPRKKMFALLIGEEIMEKKMKAAGAKPTKKGGVPRGKTPGVRSDSQQVGRLNEAEKRAKRLENQRI